MKHLASILNEFIKIAIEADWWKKLTPEQQKEYIKQHRLTKLKPALTDEQKHTRQLLSSIPKEWKKELVRQYGVGESSKVEQLPDVLKPRQLKNLFDGTNIKAVIGFKAGTPITEKVPIFYIKPSYEKDKFEAQIFKEDNSVKPITKTVTKNNRRNRYNPTYNYQKRDLRMTNIVESLPDQAYTVFAIRSDEERSKIHQMRETSKSTTKIREIELKLISNTIKPMYDFYKAKLEDNISKLSQQAVPSFESVISGVNDMNELPVVKNTMDTISLLNNKLSYLSSDVSAFKFYHLPSQGKLLSENKHEIKGFLNKVKEIKNKYVQDRKTLIVNLLKRNQIDEANKQLQEFDSNDTTIETALNLMKTLKEKKRNNQPYNEEIAQVAEVLHSWH